MISIWCWISSLGVFCLKTFPATQVIELVEGIQKATSMLSVTGYLTLELSVPSNGILPDMSFQVAQLSMMLRTGPGSGQDSCFGTSLCESFSGHQ